MRRYALKIFVALPALGLLLLASGAVWAQGRVYEPAAGSVERKAIMDALRKPVEIKLNRPVLFRVPPSSGFRAQNGWAFLTAELRKPDGSPMDFRGTPYADRDHESDEGDSLLHRTQGRWRVVALALCPSDVEWGDWRRKYHAPAAIFPPTH
jgi:hypothetical protein